MRVLISLSVAIVSVILVAGVMGQRNREKGQPAIVLGPSVHISVDNPTTPHVESFLALNQKNPAQMVATSILFEHGERTSVVYSSRDGGLRWERSATFDAGVPAFSGGDPVVYYDSSGAALFGSIESVPDAWFRIWRSSDGGLHWNSAVEIAGGHYDREYLAIDSTSSPYVGRVYSAGSINIRQTNGNSYPVLAMTYSIDNGVTFKPAIFVDVTSDGQPGGFGGAVDPLITSQGTLIVPFQSSTDLTRSENRQFWTLISENGGRSYSRPRPGLPMGRGPRGFRGTKTSSNIRAAIDQSKGAFADRIYVTWVDFANDRYNIKVTHSDDLGLTWSAPVRVNDNTAPDDLSNAAIAINRDGIVALIWNDRRDDPKGECYRLYVSASADGGETFLPNIQVDRHPTCPNTPGNWSGSLGVPSSSVGEITLSGMPGRFSNGGETQGLVAGPDGRFHVTWSNGESGVMQLWYTSFAVYGGTQAAGVRRVTETSKTIETTDRTKDVRMEVSAPLIDFASKTLGVTVGLKNQSSTYIPAPLTVVLESIESDFAGMTVANADNGLKQEGAVWKFLLNGKGLAPGEESEKRDIRWQFDGKVPSEFKDPLSPIHANFRIISGAGTTQPELKK